MRRKMQRSSATTTVLSFRVTRETHFAIATEARRRGLTVSDMIGDACLAAIQKLWSDDDAQTHSVEPRHDRET